VTLTPFYRRSLYFTLASLIAGLVVRNWPESTTAAVVAPADSPARAEARLDQLRATAATVPAKEAILKDAQADLASREKSLIVADTAAQAEAQLMQIVRALGRNEAPPVEIRNTDSLAIRPFGDSYGEVTVGVQVDCRVDQLVNMLAALAARPELVSTSDLRITSTNAKEKNVSVHLTVSGIVPRKLVPEKHS
jgi:Type II secretion system (T2SS), protein M subtype b